MQIYILVAGIEYHSLKPNFFLKFCVRRKESILKKNINDNIEILIFDFQSGIIHKYSKYLNGSEKYKKIKNYSMIRKINYNNYNEFKPNGKKFMSIIDIYKVVQDIGSNNKNTLMELSFFSHSYNDGPILVNSYDCSSCGNGRDINDMDARASKDFRPPTMTISNKKKFQDAFHKDGYAWIWGCNAHSTFKKIVFKIIKLSKSNPADTLLIDIKNLLSNNDQKKYFWYVIKNYMSPKEYNNAFNIKKIQFKYIKSFCCYHIESSYSYSLAEVLNNRKVYGVLPGMFAEYSNQTMKVNVEKNFKDYIKFFEKYFYFKIKNNYGDYCSYSCKLSVP